MANGSKVFYLANYLALIELAEPAVVSKYKSGISGKSVNPDFGGGGVIHANLERCKVWFSRKTGEGGRGKAIWNISRLFRVFSIEGFPYGTQQILKIARKGDELK